VISQIRMMMGIGTPAQLPDIRRPRPKIRGIPSFGGMSRVAKGADCKSAGYAFVGSSPTSPTIDRPFDRDPVTKNNENTPPTKSMDFL
jgi:hypothetical protein